MRAVRKSPAGSRETVVADVHTLVGFVGVSMCGRCPPLFCKRVVLVGLASVPGVWGGLFWFWVWAQ